LDKCDNDAEDKDGFEDGDGCPDPDNDKDGVLDAQDKCPNEKETLNGVDDTDGCPDQGKVLVEVKAEEIRILQQVNFDTGKATIKADSFNILKVVAQVLKSNPQVKKIEIQGHTDDVGGDAGNLTLSEGRASSVRDFLIKEGVQPERLVAKGYGETKPLVSLEGLKEKKQLDGARALNRRVQFIILEQPKPE
jgi:outer membrane protein OmpA-like peptidoglycan-associated protein